MQALKRPLTPLGPVEPHFSAVAMADSPTKVHQEMEGWALQAGK